MKLQKRLSRIYNGKKYYKYLIVIPEKEIKNSGLKEGDNLECKSRHKEIKITLKE